ncbi:MAG: translation initiation factor IF-3 [SAR202 cluster bacterium]|nr:translation initiation factor IF-3 [SAR202 cluster bacterium]
MGGVNTIVREYRVNEGIRTSRVRVVDANGEQLGIMTIGKALDLARQQQLDLVEVSPGADPPVCRVLDYGKLRYLHAKKVKESRKAQKSTEMREIRFRPNIGVHDLDAKTRKVKELLEEGAKVKVAVFFRGREMTHPELGMILLRKVTEEMKDVAKLERPPVSERNNVSVILVPANIRPEKKPEAEKKPAEVKNA